MLRTLEIRDILIIDRLELEFRPGLNVLTGETGAGKSILLDALGFVLGWRGRSDLLRAGAKQGEVTASFEIASGHPAAEALAEAGIDHEPGDELILRRISRPDGRKTAWVNGTRVTGSILRRLSEELLELHGQHDDRGLLDARGHRLLLDQFAGLDLTALGVHWVALGAAREAMAQSDAALAEIRQEEDFLRHSLSELDSLSPKSGEEATLDAERRRMQLAEKLRDDVSRAAAAISTDGAEGLLRDALRWLERAAEAEAPDLHAAEAALQQAMEALGMAEDRIGRFLDAAGFDSNAIDLVADRLFAIRGLARKHGVLADDLPDLAEEMRAKLDALDDSTGGQNAARAALAAAQVAYDAEAARASEARREAARALGRAMTSELPPLKMDRAEFSVELTARAPGPAGIDAVRFVVAPNPGAPAGPLDRIASGGELSRFLLALKVSLSQASGARTMIFDEIDRGVGGATADAVGRRLSALASVGQVIVVTHSPQVAAQAAHHWRVAKTQADTETVSTVTPLSAGERVKEIARMLSGDRISNEAKAAAKSLLAGAHR